MNEYAAKFCAVSRSPLTEIWGESQCSGHFASQLKFAGYDMVMIQGKSEKPVYIAIDNEKIEVRDTTHRRGKDGTDDVVALLPPTGGG